MRRRCPSVNRRATQTRFDRSESESQRFQPQCRALVHPGGKKGKESVLHVFLSITGFNFKVAERQQTLVSNHSISGKTGLILSSVWFAETNASDSREARSVLTVNNPLTRPGLRESVEKKKSKLPEKFQIESRCHRSGYQLLKYFRSAFRVLCKSESKLILLKSLKAQFVDESKRCSDKFKCVCV